MDLDARGRTDLEVKAEDDSSDTRMADDKPTYRSWKKKYRKMRITFDQKMHEGEDLHRLEQKALATARRLAVQKE
jgi:IEC3 subunit of the Ino80 complex, chromatin re-modelling